MRAGEVAALLHVVAVVQIGLAPAEAGGRGRSDAQAGGIELRGLRVGVPFADGAATGALRTGVLLRVLGFVEEHHGRRPALVEVAVGGPVEVGLDGDVFDIGVAAEVGIPVPCPVAAADGGGIQEVALRGGVARLGGVVPVADIHGADSSIQSRGQCDGEVGVVGHVDAAVVAAVGTSGHCGHVAALQGERVGLVAVLAQVGGVAQCHGECPLVSGGHEGSHGGGGNHHGTAQVNLHAAVCAVYGCCAVDGHVTQIRADDLAGADGIEHEPRLFAA